MILVFCTFSSSSHPPSSFQDVSPLNICFLALNGQIAKIRGRRVIQVFRGERRICGASTFTEDEVTRSAQKHVLPELREETFSEEEPSDLLFADSPEH